MFSFDTFITNQIVHSCFQNLVEQIILRKLIEFTCQLLLSLNSIFNCLCHIQFSTHNRERFMLCHILSI